MKHSGRTDTFTPRVPVSSSGKSRIVMMPVLRPPRSFTVQSEPLNRPFLRLLRRHTSLSPAAGIVALEAAPLAHARVVGAARGVAPDQHLVGFQHALRIEVGLAHHLGLAVAAGLEILAGANVHRQPDDRVALRLAVHFGQHDVGLGLGEEAAGRAPPCTGGNCAGSPSTSTGTPNDNRSRPSSASTIEHSSMTIRSALEAGASS